MLIINNGVPKSGSTWVQNILVRGLDPAFPTEKWRNSWVNPSVDHANLRAYVESGEWCAAATLIKMHFDFRDEHDYLLRDDIRIVVSYRNIPDSVVSWFHHDVRMGRTSPEHKRAWMERRGRAFAERALKHRLSWKNRPGTLLVRYEDMLADAVSGVGTIFTFIGQEKTRDECVAIAQMTQVRLKPDEPLRDGRHVRTAGRSVARDELPEHLYDEFTRMEKGLTD